MLYVIQRGDNVNEQKQIYTFRLFRVDAEKFKETAKQGGYTMAGAFAEAIRLFEAQQARKITETHREAFEQFLKERGFYDE